MHQLLPFSPLKSLLPSLQHGFAPLHPPTPCSDGSLGRSSPNPPAPPAPLMMFRIDACHRSPSPSTGAEVVGLSRWPRCHRWAAVDQVERQQAVLQQLG